VRCWKLLCIRASSLHRQQQAEHSTWWFSNTVSQYTSASPAA
jgi:hypothetical protein